MGQQDKVSVVEQVRKMKEHGLTIYQIMRKTGLTETEAYAILRSLKPVCDQNKFPIQLLEDWDRTRLWLLRICKGENYVEEKQ